MTTQPVNVCFTMDCERIAAFSPCGGPDTWEMGEEAVRGYGDFLGERGYRVTYFVVPETAEAQAPLFRGMTEAGHECGLHFHPQSWRENYRGKEGVDYLGGYPADEQLAMLGQAREQWAGALGTAPTTFRSGNVSGNDATFPVLETLGFKTSSISQPNRCVPSYRAVWSGADRTVHRAHRAFRLIAGDLDLVEVPLTVDVNRTDHWTGVGDTRFEDCDAPGILRAIEQELTWQRRQNSRLLHVCLFTHNCMGYRPQNKDWKYYCFPVLKDVVEGLPGLAERLGLSIAGTTLAQVRDRFLENNKPS